VSRFFEKAIERLERLPDIQVKQILQQLLTEHELLESSLNSIPQGLAVTSSEHNLLFFNKSIEKLLQWKNLDLNQEPIWEKLEDQELAIFLKENLISESTVFNQEYAFSRNSLIFIYQISILPLVKKGKIHGGVFLVEDISEKRNREVRLRRAESLASLTTLAAGVAHEIKNPLGSIGIHIQLIQKAIKQAGSIRPNTILQYLDVVNEELDRLNGIVVDFLFAVRPMDIKLLKGSLNKVVQDIVQFLKYELEQSNITIRLELEKDDDSILMDERFLKQAILNIIKNSIHAMPEGGKIKISTLKTSEDVRLMISDSGIGIPEENIEKIFEPYFTTKPDGTGLGLTLVYKIIKEHGAEIEVMSRPGSGTTVTIHFPLIIQPVHRLLSDGANK
jgi:two-component system, sporulation sensor kinase E